MNGRASVPSVGRDGVFAGQRVGMVTCRAEYSVVWVDLDKRGQWVWVSETADVAVATGTRLVLKNHPHRALFQLRRIST